MRTRPPRPIEQGDQNRIIAALERPPEEEGFVGYRTRAFVYLLWDGALRTGAAVCLNAEGVVKDPNATRIHVVEEPVMRPCEGNKVRERRFLMSERTRAAIADYHGTGYRNRRARVPYFTDWFAHRVRTT